MKNVFRILPLAIALLLFSCKKEEVTPVTPGITSTVHVEYRVYAASSNVTVYQDVSVSGQNTLVQEKVTVNRSTYSYSFDVMSGTMLRLKATNTNPGPEEVIAEIFVNDQLLYTGSATTPGAYAVTAGIAR
jgi:hypothetical protein